MAAHGFSEAQMAYIETNIGIKADELQGNLREISTNAQITFDLSQRKLEALFTEATSNATRVDAQVNAMNDLKNTIEAKIAQHEAAIVASGQSVEIAQARFTALMGELEGSSGRTESLVTEAKTAGDLTHSQSMEEFQKFRDNMELWYAGIKAHVERNGGGFEGKGARAAAAARARAARASTRKTLRCGSCRMTSTSCLSATGSTLSISSWRPCTGSSMRVSS